MIPSQVLPTALIIIDIGAAVIYGWDGDWRRLIYWLAAAILTATVTF